MTSPEHADRAGIGRRRCRPRRREQCPSRRGGDRGRRAPSELEPLTPGPLELEPLTPGPARARPVHAGPARARPVDADPARRRSVHAPARAGLRAVDADPETAGAGVHPADRGREAARRGRGHLAQHAVRAAVGRRGVALDAGAVVPVAPGWRTRGRPAARLELDPFTPFPLELDPFTPVPLELDPLTPIPLGARSVHAPARSRPASRRRRSRTAGAGIHPAHRGREPPGEVDVTRPSTPFALPLVDAVSPSTAATVPLEPAWRPRTASARAQAGDRSLELVP